MDISALKPTEIIVDILHPATKEPLGIKVSVLSITDEKMKKVKRKIQDERIRLERKGKSFQSTDIEENEMALLFSAMTGWDWGKEADFHGEQPEFNRANVSKVLSELTWFKDQVMEAVSDEEAFF